jgi:hypothetical protein
MILDLRLKLAKSAIANLQSVIPLLSLSLLKARILFVNNIQFALSAYDLTIDTAFFY